ncbi:MAG TPA: glutamate-5-semialdehyde dehydrogenase [Roseiflexaceae bacterium]|nr:glutamate-5-semialdehyde dehydrogenase [Roseiflexaceae bacterium]
MIDLDQMGQRARAAARRLGLLGTEQKNAALEAIAQALTARGEEVLAANALDMERGRAAGTAASLLDRMLLTPQRLAAIAADVRNVARLPDPVGELFEPSTLPNGLRLHKRRVPFGVVGVIYEARPNVTVDVATLCLKSGNTTILRGGKEISHSCAALVALIRDALAQTGIPADAVQVIDDPDRALVERLLRLDRYVDMIIPRGGAALQQFCREHGTVPVITGGIGVCHIYVDQAADTEQVVPIVRNAKVQRPSVCNALDTLLVHRAVAGQMLPAVAADLLEHGVELRADEATLALLHAAGIASDRLAPARPEDFGVEFLSLVCSVRVVDDLDAALDHIARYGSGHSEAILTEDPNAAEAFVAAVDASVVLVNASTRFNDGAQMGLGAEIAISTQKLHARGPMALRELTTYKWVIQGDGQVRL